MELQYLPPSSTLIFSAEKSTFITTEITELPMISKDEHYDFDYQETRHLSKPVVMKPVSISERKVTKI